MDTLFMMSEKLLSEFVGLYSFQFFLTTINFHICFPKLDNLQRPRMFLYSSYATDCCVGLGSKSSSSASKIRLLR